MVRSIAGQSFPARLLATLVERTDGIPLFIEELTKAVLEVGVVEGKIDEQQFAGLLAPRSVPMALRGSLMARLDRLSPVKEVAQIGATIGREFPFTLLHAVAAELYRVALDNHIDVINTYYIDPHATLANRAADALGLALVFSTYRYFLH